MIPALRSILLALCLGLASLAVLADSLLMIRSPQPFAETMLALQDAIREQGFKVSRVQRVDVGLTAMGFKTDKYRVVFFGRPEQVRRLSHEHPELVPYLPLKIAIFAERDDTLLVAANPRELGRFYHSEVLQPVFEEWAEQMQAIFDKVRQARD
ncbi:DUF302 domain-containing protein [Thiohalobacter sp. IOR34]|uniref:DUF302 domain-containing protein n=1 Tax=Thiohalobacter sp. IOR34 TaxID=3057176 RepID=UPI0025B002C1|nr:DUF302 domain-containing protein [Thiohalobacter sp. IOR34]WJW75584.1 DUF302 domain-containing protein [Thiohalobacter sp. IOR34]